MGEQNHADLWEQKAPDNHPKIFSQVYGMMELTSGVNERSGSFQASIVLGRVSSGIQDPVNFSYTLSIGAPGYYYGRSSSAELRTSTEFSTNVPFIRSVPIGVGEKTPDRIFFANGEVDRVEQLIELDPPRNTRHHVRLAYHRLHDIQVERFTRPNPGGAVPDYFFTIYYKNGIVEYYDERGYIVRIASSSGASLLFSYYPPIHNGITEIGRPLRAVYEDCGQEFNPDEMAGNYILLSEPPRSDSVTEAEITVTQVADGRKAETKYHINSRRGWSGAPYSYYIDWVSLPNEPERRIAFEYTRPGSFGYHVFSGLRTPNGKHQFINAFQEENYTDSTKYPSAQILLEEDDGGALAKNKRMIGFTFGRSYSESATHNFTGYSPGRKDGDVLPGIDYCIAAARDDYQYETVTNYIDEDANNHILVIRVFNRFHLLVSETTVRLGYDLDFRRIPMVQVEYAYPLSPGNISKQPSNFSLWTRKTTKFGLGFQQLRPVEEREVTEIRSFDEEGNLLSHTQTSGIREEYDYYPKGQWDARFANSIRKAEIISPEVINGESEKKVIKFSYARITGRSYKNLTGDTITPSMVLEENSYVVSGANDQLVNTTRYRHELVPAWLIGVPTESTTASTILDGGKQITYTYTTQYEHQHQWIDSKRLVTISKRYIGEKIGGGSCRIEASGGSCIFSPSLDLIYEEISPFGSKTMYEYDQRDWLASVTSFAGTENEEVEQYNFRYWYQPFKHDKIAPAHLKNLHVNRHLTIRSNGLKIYRYLDRDGKLIFAGESVGKAESEGDDDSYGNISREIIYNNSLPDQDVTSDSTFDYISEEGGKVGKIVASTKYDNLYLTSFTTTYPDGRREIVKDYLYKNPRTMEMYVGAGLKFTEKYNAYDLVAERLVGSTSLEENSYDGFGRLIKKQLKHEGVESRRQSAVDAMMFQYDRFDRVVKAICGDDVTEYVYSPRIPFMNLLEQLKGIATYSIESEDGHQENKTEVVMNATRKYDEIGRLIEQVTPGSGVEGDNAEFITERYEYDVPEAQEPNKVIGILKCKEDGRYSEVSRHKTESLYHPQTRLLEYVKVSGGGSKNVGATRYEFSYNPKTKDLETSVAREFNVSGESVGVQSRFNYEYNIHGDLIKVTGRYSKYPTYYSITREYSKFSQYMTSMRLKAGVSRREIGDNAEDFARFVNHFDESGRLSRRIYTVDGFGEVEMVVEYVEVGNNGGGKIKAVVVKCARGPLWEIKFSYDEGERNNGVAVFCNGSKKYYEVINYAGDSRVDNFEHHYMDARLSCDAKFEYSSKYLQLRRSVKTNLNKGGESISDYSFAGFHRLSQVIQSRTGGGLSYTYRGGTDAIASYGHGKQHPSRPPFFADYDLNGNLIKYGNDNAFVYNEANQLVRVDKSGGDMCSTYLYDPGGRLIQIAHLAKAGGRRYDLQSGYVSYIYDNNQMLGEVSVDRLPPEDVITKALYLWVEGIPIGRYVKRSGGNSIPEELELFAADTSGSVRCIYRYSPDSREVGCNYYEYADYGERYEAIPSAARLTWLFDNLDEAHNTYAATDGSSPFIFVGEPPVSIVGPTGSVPTAIDISWRVRRMRATLENDIALGHYSLSFWFRKTTSCGQPLIAIFDEVGRVCQWMVIDTSGRLESRMNAAGRGSSLVAGSGTRYDDGVWHKVVYTCSLQAGQALYVDGHCKAAGAVPSPLRRLTSIELATFDPTLADRGFLVGETVALAELEVFNFALSQTEITAAPS
ncbi:LamG-like jellyroll fold domain-containing protein [Burkholderia ubonensis]|uniref:LamG-like jellyroll fold domain-containing protein n=1 Tax=Burkholderia ubonensis TaxID=101571 RepID=UPI0009B3ED91|nr:LamG-like jellyroll fold domain-containing protein [Burkholderia ubonensis]